MLKSMIPGLIRAAVVTICLLGTFLVPVYVYAVEAPTDTSLPPVEIPDSSLYITAYYTQALENSATGLVAASRPRYVELYNTSSDPIDMEGWKLKIEWSSKINNQHVVTRSHLLSLDSGEKNYMPPNNYAVVSFNDAVGGASYSANLENAETGQYVSGIQLYHENVKPYTVAIDDVTRANTTELPLQMRLGQTTTGYTSTGKYKPDERNTLYDNGLYSPRSAINAIPVEIIAHSRNCSPEDVSIDCGDYVKFYNATNQTIDFEGTRLRIGYQGQSVTKSNTVQLSGVVEPGKYMTFSKDVEGNNLSVTNSGGFVWLEDMYGIVTYKNTITEYPDASSVTHKGEAWALDDNNTWRWTIPSPFGANTFLPVEIKPTVGMSDTRVPCRTDQYRSEETGRCRNIATNNSLLKACEVNQYRSAETNRCRNNVTASTASLTPCKPGQVRNPDTNRCRAIVATASAQLKPCEEGKVRNPETNRCRNAEATVLGDKVGFAVEKTAATDNSAGVWALGVIGVLILGRGAWEWRFELLGFARKMVGVFGSR
jgi:hypothetical protein